MDGIGKWMPEKDSRRVRPWVITRKNGGRSLTGYTEILLTKTGDARRFGSIQAAQKICDDMNKTEGRA